MKNLKVSLLAVVLVLASCGGKDDNNTLPTAENTPEVVEAQKVEDTNSKDAKEVTLHLESNDQMKYNKNELKVYAGQKVTLVFTHTGKLPITAMGHNFVLLKKGTNIAEFASQAMTEKDNGYIPKSDAILANTKTIGGGDSVTITFDAPEKGTYDYICSFPGHYSIMKGKFIVE